MINENHNYAEMENKGHQLEVSMARFIKTQHLIDKPSDITIVDIIDKTTIPPTSKRINHFNAYGNLVYISTNYGISVFNLERLEFGDTYFIGNNSSSLEVYQTELFNGFIYAATNDGVFKAFPVGVNSHTSKKSGR